MAITPVFCEHSWNQITPPCTSSTKIKTHQKRWQKPRKLQQNKWKQHGDCISQQSAVLNLQLISRFFGFFQARGEKEKEAKNSHQKLGKTMNKTMRKTMGMLLKCIFLTLSRWKTRGLIEKKYQNPSKTMAKTKKTSAKQMEKGWGLHFSAMLNLQHISEFFLTFCRVKAEKGEK